MEQQRKISAIKIKGETSQNVNVKIAWFVWSKNGPKLQIRETFTAASKMKWLVILRILEINCK